MSLKQKTVNSLFWSFAESFINQIVNFIVGIILARLLSPKEFGLVGMIMIFIVISGVFIDSGFSQALIRKQDCNQKDFSTIFYFNLIVSVAAYSCLFFTADAISTFYKEPQLRDLIRVLGIGLPISALSLIHRTLLMKSIDFKAQTKTSILSSMISGVIGVGMACSGFGVWSLVWRNLSQNIISTVLLWLRSKWHPQLFFCINSFKEMFGFGSKLLASGLIDSLFNSMYYLIIGKYYSSQELGYYSRADNFQNMVSLTLTGVIQRVSYPVLSTMQHDKDRLKSNYKKLVRNTMFLSFFLLFGMAAMAKQIIFVLIGAKWLPSVTYLQLLSFSASLYPLHALNLNILNVCGRSDLFLRLEILKKIILVPTIVIGIFYGIPMMIISIILTSIVAYFLNSFWSGVLINYSVLEQIKDITPAFMAAAIMGFGLYNAGEYVNVAPGTLLIGQIVCGGLFAYYFASIFRFELVYEIKSFLCKTSRVD